MGSLAASYTSQGVWVGELTAHIRDFISGSSNVIYRHNVAHDGSMSRVLSLLQLERPLPLPRRQHQIAITTTAFDSLSKNPPRSQSFAQHTPHHQPPLLSQHSYPIVEVWPRESHQHVRVSSRRLPQPLHQPPRRLPQLLEVATTSACCGRASR